MLIFVLAGDDYIALSFGQCHLHHYSFIDNVISCMPIYVIAEEPYARWHL